MTFTAVSEQGIFPSRGTAIITLCLAMKYIFRLQIYYSTNVRFCKEKKILPPLRAQIFCVKQNESNLLYLLFSSLTFFTSDSIFMYLFFTSSGAVIRTSPLNWNTQAKNVELGLTVTFALKRSLSTVVVSISSPKRSMIFTIYLLSASMVTSCSSISPSYIFRTLRLYSAGLKLSSLNAGSSVISTFLIRSILNGTMYLKHYPDNEYVLLFMKALILKQKSKFGY